MKCIDFRARPGPIASFEPEYFTRRSGGDWPLREKITDFINKMNEAGIDIAVLVGRFNVEWNTLEHISTSNEKMAEICREYPNRFKGIAGLDASWGTELRTAYHGKFPARTINELEEIASMDGMIGICLETGWDTIPMYIDDARLYPVYEKCQELGLLVKYTMSSHIGPTLDYGIQWLQLDRIAYHFPEVKFIVGHAGWPFVQQMIGVAHSRKNVYLMPDSYLHNHQPGSERYVEAANTFMADNFLFGSTYPLMSLNKAVEEANMLPFVDEERREKYLWKNAAILLKFKM